MHFEAVLGASAVTETASARVFSDRVGDTARVFSDRAVDASARVFSDRVGDAARVFPDRAVTASTRVFSDRVGDAARVLSNRAVDAAAAKDPELRALLEKLQNSLSCLQAGGEIPCHFTTLTTAIYHWQDLAQILQKYDAAVTRRRHGRSDPLEPAERKLSLDRRLVLKYPGVVAWYTGYKMELFYKHVLKYEDGEGVFEWGAGGIMHLHSINFGAQMPRVDPAREEWRLPSSESVRTAEEFARVHEEYVTDWSFGKAEKWSQQDIENAPARKTAADSPLHSDAESDGSEDLELSRVKETAQPARKRARLQPEAAPAASQQEPPGAPFLAAREQFSQQALPVDADFARVFPSPTGMAYVKDGAGKRKIVHLTCQEKALLQDLEALLAQAEWHPCRIGTEQKALLMTNNCQLVRRVRRKWYRKLTEKCNMHDRHSGHGVEVPPVYVEVAMEQAAGQLEGDTGRRLISEEVFDLAVGSLNLFQQPLRQDVRARIGEYDVFCMQEVTPSTLPAILSAGRELGYDVVSPAQRGHSTLEGFDVCMLLRNATVTRLRVGVVPLTAAGVRHLLHVQVQVTKNGACLALATAHCTASAEFAAQRASEMEVVWNALEALPVGGCIFAGDTNTHASEKMPERYQERWQDAWEADGAEVTLSGTWCHDWMDTSHPSVQAWRFDRCFFLSRAFRRAVPEDEGATFLSATQQPPGASLLSASESQPGDRPVPRSARQQTVRLVQGSFQRVWGVGMSDHACISSRFLVQAGAGLENMPQAEYLRVVRPGLGSKVARRPAEHESCARKTQTYAFCSKDYEKSRMPPGKGVILEDPRRKGLYRLYARRNCHHVNTHDPLKAMGLVANVDDQVVLTIQAAVNYLTKYMGKLGSGHTATSRIGGLLDDILCRMRDDETMTVTSLLSKLFIHTAVPDQICSLEAWPSSGALAQRAAVGQGPSRDVHDCIRWLQRYLPRHAQVHPSGCRRARHAPQKSLAGRLAGRRRPRCPYRSRPRCTSASFPRAYGPPLVPYHARSAASFPGALWLVRLSLSAQHALGHACSGNTRALHWCVFSDHLPGSSVCCGFFERFPKSSLWQWCGFSARRCWGRCVFSDRLPESSHDSQTCVG